MCSSLSTTNSKTTHVHETGLEGLHALWEEAERGARCR